MKRSFIIGYVIICSFFIHDLVEAQSAGSWLKDEFTETPFSNTSPDITFDVGQHRSNLWGNLSITAKAGHVWAKLDAGEDYLYGNEQWDADISFTVIGYDQNAAVIFSFNSDVIKIDQTTPEKLIEFDITNKLSQLDQLEFTAFSVTPTTASAGLLSSLQNALRITAGYDLQFGVDVIDGNGNYLPIEITTASQIDTLRVITFDWQTSGGIQYPVYEFQLLRLFNTNPSYTDPRQIEATIDWSTALSVLTTAKPLELSIAEGTGIYVWRVRPVGTRFNGGVADTRNFGPWTTKADGTDWGLIPESINEPDILSTVKNPFFWFLDPDDDKNWIYTRSFSENNHISEQISYGTKLLQGKQSQTYLPSVGQKVVTQTVLDFNGRPALNALPAPMPGKLHRYEEKVLKDEAYNNNNYTYENFSELYTAEDFDRDDNYRSPTPVKVESAADAMSYYDENYNDEHLPDGEGYPFSRVLYYNDGTNRVSEQSGVGSTHMIGVQANGQGRTVRTYYGKAEEEELIRIFGDEAPVDSSVVKVINVDANNTTTVSYIIKEGRMIASALSFNDKESAEALLEELDPATYPANTFTPIQINDIITTHQVVPNGIVSTKRLALAHPTPVTLTYRPDCKMLNEPCYSFSCNYSVQFNLIYLDDPSNSTLNITGAKVPIDCQSLPGVIYPDWTTNGLIDLEPGNYIIQKWVTQDPANKVTVTDEIERSKLHTQAFIEVIINLLAGVKTKSQLDMFYADVTGLMTSPPPDFPYDSDDGFEWSAYSVSVGFEGLTPVTLTVGTPCCGELIIPLRLTEGEYFQCPEDLDTPKVSHFNFEAYMKDMLVTALGLFPDDQTMYSTVLPGYQPGQFDEMVYHMVTDKYACEPGETATTQYDCEAVWNCWKAMVGSYADIQAAENPDQDDNLDSGSDQQDDPDDGNDFDEQMDDIPGGFLVKWLVRSKLSQQLRMDEDLSAPRDMRTNLAELFLECTGYRFADVVTPGNSPEADYDANNRPFYISEEVGGNTVIVPHPFIKDAIFAFKYYEYAAGTSEPCEKIFCYNAFAGPPDPCNPVVCPTGYMDWDCDQRKYFFDCLASEPTVLEKDPNSGNDLTDPAITVDWINDRVVELNDKCSLRCDERAAEFRAAIINMIQKRCYTIGGCETDPYNIPQRDIDAMVDTVLMHCQLQCNLTGLAPDGPSGPDENNPVYNSDGPVDISCGNFMYTYYRVGGLCEQYFMDQAMFWDFDIDTDLPSGCEGEEGTDVRDYWSKIKSGESYEATNNAIDECSDEDAGPDIDLIEASNQDYNTIEYSKTYLLPVKVDDND